MAERTPNGPADLLADDEAPPTSSYTIDDEESPPSPKGSDPSGSNEREPSLLSRLSTGAASTTSEDGMARKPSRQAEVALAEKTSKIMSDYQAYLSEIETEFPRTTEEVDAERSIANVREEHRYKDDVGSSFAPPDTSGSLYRGWSREHDGERMIHIDRGVDHFEHTSRFPRGRATRVGSQKRVKRGIAMIVLVSLIVGLSVAISNKKKRESLPDWEAELAATQSQKEAEEEALAKEKEKEEQMEHHDEMAGPGYTDSLGLTEAQSMQIAAVAQRFQPTFYDRRTGWKGQTYVEALEFCQDKNDYKDTMLRVCPYEAICPGGEGSRPISGHLNENGNLDILAYGGSWMPVIDDPNDWVSVGSDNSCVRWSTLYDGTTPDWGNTGEGNEVNTRHLVCCNADAVEGFEEDEVMKEKQQEEEDKATALAMASDAAQMSAAAGDSNIGVIMAEDAGFDMNQATLDEIANIESEGNLNAQDDAALPYEIAASKFKPVFFDRDSGWTGSTYYDAVSFCENTGNNLHVCPFQAVCPKGLGEMPIRTFNADDMMWLPVSDEENSWVSATRQQPCLPFKNQADWGKDQEQAEKMTEFLVCCTITSDTSGMILGVADLTGTPATTAAEAIVADAITAAGGDADAEYEAQTEDFKKQASQIFEQVSDMFEPILYTREKGWTGQTFLEGMDFCASSSDVEERSICPLAAICPLGKGGAPTMGTQDGPDGGFSWVPIADDANAWVQVSSRDTCLTYAYMNDGEGPQWGLDGQGNEETTRYIYCCLSVPGTGQPTPSESESQPVQTTPAATPEPTPNPTPEPTPNPTPNPTETTVTGITSSEEEELYAASAQTYQPIIYDSTSTPAWTGQAYLEALQFCASIDSRVPCPYLALCPAGAGKSPSGGVKSGYLPLIEHPNSWVNIGPTDTCQTYSEINGGPPDWGLTGDGDSENTPYVACCLDMEDDKSEETSEAENNASDEIVLTENEQAVMDAFKPEWFGRGAGYQGSSYLDAIDFCAGVAGKSLCPSMAYCPNYSGEQSSYPLYLQLNPFEGEQWAPIRTQTGDVDYIMIGTYNGDPGSTCKSYAELIGIGVPSWGMDGTSEDLKQEILCCLDPTFSTQGVITPTVEEDLNIPVVQTEESPTLDDGSFDLEGAVNLDLEPVWLDEEDGWDGGSHDDAESLCQQTVGKSLCPYAAYCPHGPGQPVLGGHDVDFKTEGLQWAPVFGANNHWILLSQKSGNSATTCMSHTDLEGTAPDWGTSNARPWLKKHVLCCNLKNGY